MRMLWLTEVFMTLRLVLGSPDVTEKLLAVSKDTNVGVPHVTMRIMDPKIKMNDAADRDDYDETTDPNWDMNRAIRDLAYYLRAHKFVDYDRRYYDKIDDVKHRLWMEFPKPPLRSLHWEVHKHCDNGFIQCLKYLDSIVQQTILKREDDTVVVMRNNKWKLPDNLLQVENVDRECKAAKLRDNRTYVPFQGPIERFQWRTTASYYMCWYTMLGRPELSHFNEPCDDFADCLTIYSSHLDARAQDHRAFDCALYSFCPDPCCAMKHIWHMDDCYRSPLNPCYKSNTSAIQKCSFTRLENQDFYALTTNQINITCPCHEPGYEWSSRFGLCVDINECTRGLHSCMDILGETCINLPGSYACLCRHGLIYDSEFFACVENVVFTQIVIPTVQEHVNATTPSNVVEKIAEILTMSYAIKCNYSNILLYLLLYHLTWYLFFF